MADDNSLLVICEGCMPTDSITVFDMNQQDVMTRPWTFTVNGNITIPTWLDNGSIAPGAQPGSLPNIDPRNVAVGADGQILTQGGDVLLHILNARLVITPATGVVQPIGSLRSMRRVLSVEATLTLTEYVINDALILKQVLPSLLPLAKPNLNYPGSPPACDAYLTFQGRVNNRICS